MPVVYGKPPFFNGSAKKQLLSQPPLEGDIELSVFNTKSHRTPEDKPSDQNPISLLQTKINCLKLLPKGCIGNKKIPLLETIRFQYEKDPSFNPRNKKDIETLIGKNEMLLLEATPYDPHCDMKILFDKLFEIAKQNLINSISEFKNP